MSKKDLSVRAWKDASFRASLSEAERAALLPNPAGDCGINPTTQKDRGGDQPMLTLVSTKCSWCCG